MKYFSNPNVVSAGLLGANLINNWVTNRQHAKQSKQYFDQQAAMQAEARRAGEDSLAKRHQAIGAIHDRSRDMIEQENQAQIQKNAIRQEVRANSQAKTQPIYDDINLRVTNPQAYYEKQGERFKSSPTGKKAYISGERQRIGEALAGSNDPYMGSLAKQKAVSESFDTYNKDAEEARERALLAAKQQEEEEFASRTSDIDINLDKELKMFTNDIDKLVKEGELTNEQYNHLLQLTAMIMNSNSEKTKTEKERILLEGSNREGLLNTVGDFIIESPAEKKQAKEEERETNKLLKTMAMEDMLNKSVGPILGRRKKTQGVYNKLNTSEIDNTDFSGN